MLGESFTNFNSCFHIDHTATGSLSFFRRFFSLRRNFILGHVHLFTSSCQLISFLEIALVSNGDNGSTHRYIHIYHDLKDQSQIGPRFENPQVRLMSGNPQERKLSLPSLETPSSPRDPRSDGLAIIYLCETRTYGSPSTHDIMAKCLVASTSSQAQKKGTIFANISSGSPKQITTTRFIPR